LSNIVNPIWYYYFSTNKHGRRYHIISNFYSDIHWTSSNHHCALYTNIANLQPT
jgi:hypothetical protein